MFRVDLHSHSTASHDGGISARQYHRILESGTLDCVAITDHNTIDFALAMKADLGDRIIVGEEIMTTYGEIIGLFLDHVIPGGLSPVETIKRIKAQDGLVYVPHPFETVRKGLHPAVLDEISSEVDIIEVCNGRAFLQNRSQQAVVWSRLNQIPGAASSDAHGVKGLGRTYSGLSNMPDGSSLVDLLKTASLTTDRPGLRALLYPKLNKLRKKIRRSA